MEKKLCFSKKLYCSIVIVLSLFAVCSNHLQATNDSQRNAQEVKVGDKAPDFTVTKDGKSVSLADLKSKQVILHFSSASVESRNVTADMAKLEERYKDADMAFINIPVDQYTNIAAAYGISSSTAIYIIDLDGIIEGIAYVDLAQKLKEYFPDN